MTALRFIRNRTLGPDVEPPSPSSGYAGLDLQLNNAPNKPQNPAKPTDKTQGKRPAADRDLKDRDQKGGQPGRKSATGGPDQERAPSNKAAAGDEQANTRDRDDTADTDSAPNTKVSGRNAKSGAPIESDDNSDGMARQNTPRKGDGPSEDDARRHEQASQNAAKATEKSSGKHQNKKS
jgi:hypothetical protein